MTHPDLLGEPPATLLPDEPGPREALAAGADAAEVAADHPTSCLAWAVLAEEALADGRTVEGYAYARTGYHRGLDALRRNGWKGARPGPLGARAEPRLPAGAARAGPWRRQPIGEDDEAAALPDVPRRLQRDRVRAADRVDGRCGRTPWLRPLRRATDEAQNRPLPRFRASSRTSCPVGRIVLSRPCH